MTTGSSEVTPTLTADRQEAAAASTAVRRPPGGRIDGIDGLRAVAALWVVVFHIGAYNGGTLLPGLDLVVRSGSIGVSLFLVLSGLCLYLPFAGGQHSKYRTNEFFRRRVRRLLPAYYASLVILLALQVAANGRFGMPLMSGSEILTQTATHLTMTHQFFPETFYGLNGAYWSLGLEWQFYLTLPFLIIAATRFGLVRTVAAVFAVTAVFRIGVFVAMQSGVMAADSAWGNVILPNSFLGRWSEFALGMLAAELYRNQRARASRPLLVAAAFGVVIVLGVPWNPLNHMIYGVIFFALVLLVLAGDNPVASVFSWRPLVAVGVISYSLYLVHQPVIGIIGQSLGLGPGTDANLAFLVLVLFVPVMMLVALALFVSVERRTLSKDSASTPVRELLFPTRDAAPTTDAVPPSDRKTDR